MGAPDKTRKRLLGRLTALLAERESWISHWQDLSDNFRPRSSRLKKGGTERNKGGKRNGNIINNTPTKAAKTLAAGMMSGITSPARPWFRLTVPGMDLNENGAVREWLADVEKRMLLTFARSNFYTSLQQLYGDLLLYGTGPLHIDEDVEDIIRCYVFPVGQYAIANSPRQQVDTIYREFEMTVGQLVERFTLEKCSPHVQDLWKQEKTEEWIEVLLVIQPNTAYREGKLGAEGKPWKSCWLEKNAPQDVGLLDEGGYYEFPVCTPRWELVGENIYGDSPAMDALGDARALQLYEKRSAQAVDKIISPPMNAPTSMRNQRASLIPADTNYVDKTVGGGTYEPSLKVDPNVVTVGGLKVAEHERRIKSALYADLWLMLAETDRRQITAREVVERHEEKFLQLGPVLDRLNDELLDPVIDRTFRIMLDRGELPPPPSELEGVDLKVEHISILAQAQKMIQLGGIERLSAFVGNLASVDREVLDVFNRDEAVKEYAEAIGTSPKIIVADELVQQKRQARASQQQAAAAAETAAVAAQGAKTLSETDLDTNSALTGLLNSVGAPGVAQ